MTTSPSMEGVKKRVIVALVSVPRLLSFFQLGRGDEDPQCAWIRRAEILVSRFAKLRPEGTAL